MNDDDTKSFADVINQTITETVLNGVSTLTFTSKDLTANDLDGNNIFDTQNTPVFTNQDLFNQLNTDIQNKVFDAITKAEVRVNPATFNVELYIKLEEDSQVLVTAFPLKKVFEEAMTGIVVTPNTLLEATSDLCAEMISELKEEILTRIITGVYK